MSQFLKNWKILTQDPNILSNIEGYKIPFQTPQVLDIAPMGAHLSQDQQVLVNQEILEMLKKGLFLGTFVKNILNVRKKDAGNRSVINSKNLNQFILYQHFKMSGFHCLKFLIQENDFLSKIELNDVYFSVSLEKESEKYIRFLWLGSLYQFLYLCFRLEPIPRIFTKLLKIPIALQRKMNIRLTFIWRTFF